jgi:hypothetical protein
VGGLPCGSDDRHHDERRQALAQPGARAALVERVEQGAHRRPALGRLGREPALAHAPQPARHAARPRRHAQAAREDAGDELVLRLSGERRLVVERLPQRHAERELVGRRREHLAEVLLRRHVTRRAHHGTGPGQRLARVALGRRSLDRPNPARARRLIVLGLGEAEVGHLARAAAAPAVVAVGHEHVRGLEVAVQHPLAVRGREAPSGLDEGRQHVAPGSRRLPQPLLQRAALDQLHRDHDPVLGIVVDVVDRHHVGVAEHGHGPRLANHARPAERIHDLGTQHLERDLALQPGIVGAEHPAHAALTELLDDEVATEASARIEGGVGPGGDEHRRSRHAGDELFVRARARRRHHGSIA